MKPSKVTETFVVLIYIIGIICVVLIATGIVYNAVFCPVHIDYYITGLIVGISIYIVGSIIIMIIMYNDIDKRGFSPEEEDFWKNIVGTKSLIFMQPRFPVIYYYSVIKKVTYNIHYIKLLKITRSATFISFYICLLIIVSTIGSALFAMLTGSGYDLPSLIISKIIYFIPLFIISFSLYSTLCVWDYVNKENKDVQTFTYYFKHSLIDVFKRYK